MEARNIVCPSRIVRDGKLAAFQGQLLTASEAEALGIKTEASKPAKPKDKSGDKSTGAPKQRTKKVAAEEAEALGIKVGKSWTLAKIDDAIAKKREELVAASNDAAKNEPGATETPQTDGDDQGEGGDNGEDESGADEADTDDAAEGGDNGEDD